MNRIERVRAALAGQPVDRIPASFWFHFPTSMSRGKPSITAHLDYYRRSGVDYLKIMNEHPYYSDTYIAVPADWRRVRPAPLSSPFYQYFLDEIKSLSDSLQGECLLIATVFNPFSCGRTSSNRVLTEHLKSDPESVNEGLKAIADSLANFAVACVEAGASGIFFAAQGGEQERFHEEEFLNYIKPHDLTVLNAVADYGEFHLIHVCGDQVRLHLYTDYPGSAFNWAATKNNLTLREGQALLRRTVIGGMDDRGILVTGSKGEIQQEVQKVVGEMDSTGFMLGADCTLPTDISVENIRYAVEATAR